MHIFTILALIFTSILIRIFLERIGQKWIATFAHTGTLTFLPIITFVITKVISGNIALSLGMVGALSIVRFRNPVRSPFELSIYFAAITMGIAASVDIRWMIFLVLSMLLAGLCLGLTSFISKRVFKKQFFFLSFSEGNTLSTLQVISKINLSILENSDFLRSKKASSNNISYLLSSNSFQVLKSISKEIENDDSIISYELTQ
tara:strand:+ start:90 stop:698 length:609 start_codon:yes stop_codon:yes gene_type:complete